MIAGIEVPEGNNLARIVGRQLILEVSGPTEGRVE